MVTYGDLKSQIARLNRRRSTHIFYFYYDHPDRRLEQFLDKLKTKFRVRGHQSTFNPEGQNTVGLAGLATPDTDNLIFCFDHPGHLSDAGIIKWEYHYERGLRRGEDDTRSGKKRDVLEVSWRQIIDRLQLAGKNVLLVMPRPSGWTPALPNIQLVGADVLISDIPARHVESVTAALAGTSNTFVNLPGVWVRENINDIYVPLEAEGHMHIRLCNYDAGRHMAGTMRFPKDEAMRQLVQTMLDSIEHTDQGVGTVKLASTSMLELTIE